MTNKNQPNKIVRFFLHKDHSRTAGNNIVVMPFGKETPTSCSRLTMKAAQPAFTRSKSTTETPETPELCAKTDQS